MHKKALVTGATRGLGRAITEQLLNDGYQVTAIARTLKDLEELKSTRSGKVITIACDLSESNFIDIVKKQLNNSEPFDVIVHNAAQYLESDLLHSVGDYKAQLKLNFYSIVQLNDFLMKGHVNPNAHLIFIGSVVSRVPRATAAAYSVSKAALASYVKSISDVYRKQNIKTCLISPGSINTSSWGDNTYQLNQMIQPEDIAQLLSTVLKLSPSTWIEEVLINPLKPGI